MSVKPLTLIMIVISVIALAGCGDSGSKLVEGKTNIVTSIYPLYFLAKEIGGDQVNVVNMIPAGVEPHDWSPKSRDLDTAAKAQLFLYNGAGLEGWVDDFLEGLPKDSKLATSEISKGIPLIKGSEEEGHDHEGEADHADEAAHEDEAAHADEAAHGGEEGHHHDVDPHTWVSPNSMLIMARNVLDSFIQVDASHKADYEANYEKLANKLAALHDRFKTELAAAPHKDIVVSHQAFGYLARDYGLAQVSIMGLSPEAEPKAQDLLEISKFVKEHGVKYIFFEELVSDELAKTLAREADVDTLVLNPLEGLTPDQEKNGDDYLSLMEANLQNLLKALQ
ncbi:zinc ABC transporter substrate-binding protein [Paenibacillus oenotherae]|uniref:Zinc ABC transporter substrate-binding protein n=2 Tax=Paenibacillus oenotherae TaxID=1435645 RepID=A0ABS7D1W3_9BACL|nr:zinc ABC transporter substrate-binding protein [Paenibacillus oenotherae]